MPNESTHCCNLQVDFSQTHLALTGTPFGSNGVAEEQNLASQLLIATHWS